MLLVIILIIGSLLKVSKVDAIGNIRHPELVSGSLVEARASYILKRCRNKFGMTGASQRNEFSMTAHNFTIGKI